MAAAQKKTSTRNFETIVRAGVAHDIRVLRYAADMSLEEVTKGLGWPARAELGRYENEQRSIGIHRYFSLLCLYWDKLPRSEQEGHPASLLLNDKAIEFAWNAQLSTPMLYQYLVWAHGMVLADQLPEHHPAEKLWRYLNRPELRDCRGQFGSSC
jgi:hypothetical protein